MNPIDLVHYVPLPTSEKSAVSSHGLQGAVPPHNQAPRTLVRDLMARTVG
jgi:hypothetical protein